MKVYDVVLGREIDSNVYTLTDNLITLSKTKPLWTVIDAVVQAWVKMNPKKWDSHLIQLKDTKETRRSKTGSSASLGVRYLADVPAPILSMIRILYPVEVLPMDTKFFREFVKRFQQFKVPDKI